MDTIQGIAAVTGLIAGNGDIKAIESELLRERAFFAFTHGDFILAVDATSGDGERVLYGYKSDWSGPFTWVPGFTTLMSGLETESMRNLIDAALDKGEGYQRAYNLERGLIARGMTLQFGVKRRLRTVCVNVDTYTGKARYHTFIDNAWTIHTFTTMITALRAVFDKV